MDPHTRPSSNSVRQLAEPLWNSRAALFLAPRQRNSVYRGLSRSRSRQVARARRSPAAPDTPARPSVSPTVRRWSVRALLPSCLLLVAGLPCVLTVGPLILARSAAVRVVLILFG